MNRKQRILEVLATELEIKPGFKITTARLADAVGVSEAALYRHFASKAKMFEALIEFAEETVFGLINQIIQNESNAVTRCEKLIQLLLRFAEKNPGITRILVGDILLGEHQRLYMRVMQFFARLETQLRQILREGKLDDNAHMTQNIDVATNQMMIYIEGAMIQFVRTRFAKKPTAYWHQHWPVIKQSITG